jgi:26S proteasome regulatory subunit N11
MLELAKSYQKLVEDEGKLSPEKLAILNVGKVDPKKHLEEEVTRMMSDNIVQMLGAMVDTIVF